MSAEPILRFRDEHRFLSNFYESPIRVPNFPAITGTPRLHSASGYQVPTVEHAFQALKASESADPAPVLSAPGPTEAKALGKLVPLREDWDKVKQQVMLACLRAKFAANTELGARLLSTGCRMLVEGNTWRDQIWGATWVPTPNIEPGPSWARGALGELRGENWLGRLLMLVRAELDCGVQR